MDFNLDALLQEAFLKRPELAGLIVLSLIMFYVAKKHFGTRREDYKIKMILVKALGGAMVVTSAIWLMHEGTRAYSVIHKFC